MDPEPWNFPGLPPTLTLQDFNDAARALASQTRVGRIVPLPLMRSRSLSGTGYNANVRRIAMALTFPSLELAALADLATGELGHIVAAILWRDSSPADGTRPVAMIGPNGYFGSVYYDELSRQLHNFMRSEAQRFQLLAAAVEIDPMPNPMGSYSVRVWLPKDDEEVQRYRRWLRGASAGRGEPYRPAVELVVSLKRLGDYQEELGQLLGDREEAEVGVQLALEPTPSGKYKGQNLITAKVLDRTIGQIPAQYRSDCPEFFAAVESGATEARASIQQYPERISVHLKLRIG